MLRRRNMSVAACALGGVLAFAGWTQTSAAPNYVQRQRPSMPTPAAPRALAPADATPAKPVDEKELAGLPKVELIQERYPDGKIHRTRYVTKDAQRNYVNHGPFAEFSPSGRKIAAGDFNMGRYEGVWLRWYEPKEGALFDSAIHKQFQQPFVSEVQLRDGVLHGIWTVTDAKKAKVSVWNFENGKRSGKSTWFYPNGNRARELDYRDGLIDGKAMAWGNYDQVSEDVTFIKGRRLAKTTYWHAPGVKAAEGDTLFALQQVEASYDWWGGKIALSKPTDAGIHEKTGVWNWWHSNGQKSCEGRFIANLADGPWEFWHGNGQKKMEGTYENGKRVGLWVTWAEDGSFVGEKTPDDSKTALEGDLEPSDSAEGVPPTIDDLNSGEDWEVREGRLRLPNVR